MPAMTWDQLISNCSCEQTKAEWNAMSPQARRGFLNVVNAKAEGSNADVITGKKAIIAGRGDDEDDYEGTGTGENQDDNHSGQYDDDAGNLDSKKVAEFGGDKVKGVKSLSTNQKRQVERLYGLPRGAVDAVLSVAQEAAQIKNNELVRWRRKIVANVEEARREPVMNAIKDWNIPHLKVLYALMEKPALNLYAPSAAPSQNQGANYLGMGAPVDNLSRDVFATNEEEALPLPQMQWNEKGQDEGKTA